MKINFYRYEILFVTLVILFGLILRGYNINLNDFWSDEMASFYLSNPNLNFLIISRKPPPFIMRLRLLLCC